MRIQRWIVKNAMPSSCDNTKRIRRESHENFMIFSWEIQQKKKEVRWPGFEPSSSSYQFPISDALPLSYQGIRYPRAIFDLVCYKWLFSYRILIVFSPIFHHYFLIGKWSYFHRWHCDENTIKIQAVFLKYSNNTIHRTFFNENSCRILIVLL